MKATGYVQVEIGRKELILEYASHRSSWLMKLLFWVLLLLRNTIYRRNTSFNKTPICVCDYVIVFIGQFKTFIECRVDFQQSMAAGDRV